MKERLDPTGADLVANTPADGMVTGIGSINGWLFGDEASKAVVMAYDATVLAGVAATLNAHHAVFAHPASPLPDWLADHLVNQMSHLRGLIWTRDGRMRELTNAMLDATLAALGKHGAQVVDQVVRYGDVYRLCYIRGPEGILIGLAQQLGG